MAATVAEVMNSKFQGLSESLSKFDEKLDRKFAELLAAIRLLTSSRTVGASSSGDRCPPSHSQVLQPPVHDLARIDKRSLSDDVSDGVVAKKCSLGTDFLNPILCESFPIEVLRSADGGLKECKSESAIINKTEKITITEDDTNDEGSLNDVLDEPAAINDVESEVNIIDECSCDARLLDVVSNKHDGVEEVKHEVNYATIQFNNSPGLSSFKDSRVCLAKSVYKPVYQVVICSVIYCSPTVCLNAHEKLVLYFLRAKPPDMNMNRRTRHGLVLSSIQHNLIKPRTCPEVSIMDIEATLGLWCSEAPPWPPDARKWLIMISKLHKRAHTVAGNILQVFAKIENFELSFQNILNEFDDVFIEPTELPPYRGDHDHRIHLLEWRHYFLAGRFTIETDQRSFKYLQEQRLNTLVQQHWLNGGIIPDEVWCLETPPWPPDVTKLLIMHLTLPKRSGVDGFNTMQVKGILGYTLSPLKSTRVALNDGNTLQVSAKVENFELSFQNVSFITDLVVIPLGNYDMVLGVQWLATLGTLLWNFAHLAMEFQVNNRKLVLHGIKRGFVRETKAKQRQKLITQNAQLAMLCLNAVANADHCYIRTPIIANGTIPRDIEVVLTEFLEQNVQLAMLYIPNVREVEQCHKLKTEVSQHVIHKDIKSILHDFEYYLSQKNDIDKIVKEMLTSRIIQPSRASFASPIHLPYLHGDSDVDVVVRNFRNRENMIEVLAFHLFRAHQRMERFANQHRRVRNFDVGDWVFTNQSILFFSLPRPPEVPTFEP